MGACAMLCSQKESVPTENEKKYIQSQIQASLHAQQNLSLSPYQKKEEQKYKIEEEETGGSTSLSKSTKTSSKSRFFVEKSIKSNKQSKQQEDSLIYSSYTQRFTGKMSTEFDKLDFIDQSHQNILLENHSGKIEKDKIMKEQRGKSNPQDLRQVEVIVKNKKLILFKSTTGKRIRQNYEKKQLSDRFEVENIQTTYEDGSSYEGETIYGLRDGIGKYFWKDGTIYEGQWKEDNIQGIGTLYFSDGDEYKGSFSKNKPNGKGQLCDFNGVIYEGQWQNGLEDGKGCENFKDQQRYCGGWMAGKKEGYGELFYLDGSYYKGNFSNNQINGKGEYNWVGKSIYKGSWFHNQKCGIGSILWQNGDKYEGEFLHDKMHGKGRYYTNSGVIYEGNWQKGRKQGYIKQIAPSGEVNESFWVFNKKIEQPTKRESTIIKKIRKNSKSSIER